MSDEVVNDVDEAHEDRYRNEEYERAQDEAYRLREEYCKALAAPDFNDGWSNDRCLYTENFVFKCNGSYPLCEKHRARLISKVRFYLDAGLTAEDIRKINSADRKRYVFETIGS